MKVHDRFTWILDVMDLYPDEYILEVGCGVGFAAEAICPAIPNGKFLAIDKSPAMLRKAQERNARFIDTGVCTFVESDFLSFDSQGSKFNKLLFFNINFFWTKKSPEAEIKKIKSLLKSSGRVYISYGPMVNSFQKIEDPINDSLKVGGLRVIEKVINKNLKCCCFIIGR